MSNLALMLSVSPDKSPDLFNAILARDWGAVGGWSLFIGLGLLIVMLVLNERLVPGKALTRLIEANQKLLEANEALTKQNGQLITANEITKHFFQETVPKRGEVREWDTSPSEKTRSEGWADPNAPTQMT